MAAPKKVRLPKVISPAAVVAYAWFDKPDVKFQEEGKGQYKGTLLLPENDPVVVAYLADITEKGKKTAVESGVKLKKGFKLGKEKAEPGDEGYKPEFDGMVLIEFKSVYPPSCFDSAGTAIPASDIRSGDVVRIAGLVKPYEAFGSGIAMKLFQIQLIEKRNAGSGESAFDSYEGGYVAPPKTDTPSDKDEEPGDDGAPNDGAGF